jgi:serine/threonine-protein kinase
VVVAHAVEPSSAPLASAALAERFRIERELGVGGMGSVYAALDLRTGTRVALKLMRPELAGDVRAVERFRREGAALAAISHPAVVQIREIGELPDGSLFLAMELLEGETLAARLERTGRMGAHELLPIVLGLCDGLTAAHAGGVIHRDIKPSNIHLPDPAVLARVTQTGQTAPVKLVDFGVARVRGLSKVTSSGLAVGTVRYMAPEQLTAGAVDERVDVYALGVVMYEALAGEHPFERAGDDPIGSILVGRFTPLSALRPDLPPAITQVVHRAMARLPTERFASAGALADAYRRALAEMQRDPLAAPSQLAAPHGWHDDATRDARPVSRDAMALAPTLPATPSAVPVRPGSPTPVPAQSAVRRKRASLRPPVWLFLPLLVGACFIPALGAAGFAGCGSYMVDLQLRLGLQKVRAGIAADASLASFEPELARLEALHREDRVDLLAASALNAHVQDGIREDDRLDSDEVRRVMTVVQDILARGGQYDLDHYAAMTKNLER